MTALIDRRFLVAAAVVAASVLAAAAARAQNDWQYPDPYFGILEIEKSRSPDAERRHRADVRPTGVKPAVRRSRRPQQRHRPAPAAARIGP